MKSLPTAMSPHANYITFPPAALRKAVLLCALCFCLLGISTVAGAAFETVQTPDGLCLTGYTGSDPVLVLPTTIDGQRVSSIGERLFAGADWLRSIIIPDTYVEIGESAFEGCSALESVAILGNKMVTIPERCFADCTALVDISLSGSVKNFEQEAFAGCVALESFSLPKGAKRIRNRVFYGCTALETVNMPNNLRTVGQDAFLGTPWLENQTDTFVIVSGGFLLRYNGQDREVVIPENVFYISNAFSGNETVETVVFPHNLKEIMAGAFENCTSLVRVDIPEGISIIGYEAFAGCTALKEVTIAQSIDSIESGAFAGCINLKQVRVLGGLARINDRVFEGCRALGFIDLPQSVTQIRKNAFRGCDMLQKIDWPQALESIGERAFAGCVTLQDADLPDSVSIIDVGAFENTGITYAFVPDKVQSLPAKVFADCKNLSAIRIGPDTQDIAEDALEGTEQALIHVIHDTPAQAWADTHGFTHAFSPETWHGFTYVDDGESVEILRWEDAKQRLDVPAQIHESPVTQIGEAAFQNLPRLADVLLPHTLQSIGNWAFSYCENLEHVNLPDALQSIGSEAFLHCTALSSLHIPRSVETIGERAFEGCPKLVLTVHEGSAAQVYAQEKGIAHEAIE